MRRRPPRGTTTGKKVRHAGVRGAVARNARSRLVLGSRRGARGRAFASPRQRGSHPSASCLSAVTRPHSPVLALRPQSLWLARELVNTPPCDLYPETFAAVGRRIRARRTGFEVEIWDE